MSRVVVTNGGVRAVALRRPGGTTTVAPGESADAAAADVEMQRDALAAAGCTVAKAQNPDKQRRRTG